MQEEREHSAQYGVIQIKGDAVRVLELCKSKQDALAAEQRHQDPHDSREGLIVAVRSVFVDGQLLENKFQIL